MKEAPDFRCSTALLDWPAIHDPGITDGHRLFWFLWLLLVAREGRAPSNDEAAFLLGLPRLVIRRNLSELVEAGLVAPPYAPVHRGWGDALMPLGWHPRHRTLTAGCRGKQQHACLLVSPSLLGWREFRVGLPADHAWALVRLALLWAEQPKTLTISADDAFFVLRMPYSSWQDMRTSLYVAGVLNQRGMPLGYDRRLRRWGTP